MFGFVVHEKSTWQVGFALLALVFFHPHLKDCAFIDVCSPIALSFSRTISILPALLRSDCLLPSPIDKFVAGAEGRGRRPATSLPFAELLGVQKGSWN